MINKPKEDMLMMNYVDDFKMSCREMYMAEPWRQLRARIRLSPYKSFDRYLGCYSRCFSLRSRRPPPLCPTCLLSQWSRLDAQGEKRVEAEPWRSRGPSKQMTGYNYEIRVYFKPAQAPFIKEAKNPYGVV